VFFTDTIIDMAWKDVRIRPEVDSLRDVFFEADRNGPGVLEINWFNDTVGKVSVSRNELIFNTDLVSNVMVTLLKQLSQFRAKLVEENRSSMYTLLNTTISGDVLRPGYRLCWLRSHNGTADWRDLQFPLVVGPSGRNNARTLTWNGRAVSIAMDMERCATIHSSGIKVIKETVSLPVGLLQPDCLMVARVSDRIDHPLTIVTRVLEILPEMVVQEVAQTEHTPEAAAGEFIENLTEKLRKNLLRELYGRSPHGKVTLYGLRWQQGCPDNLVHQVGSRCKFPPAWRNLCGAIIVLDRGLRAPNEFLWNEAHPLGQAIDQESWTWARKTFQNSLDPLPYEAELTQSRAKVSAWLANFLWRGDVDEWTKIRDSNAKFLSEVWHIIFSRQETSDMTEDKPFICFWRGQYTDHPLCALTPVACSLLRDEDIEEFLPVPEPVWILE
jgi:hypothetical protein